MKRQVPLAKVNRLINSGQVILVSSASEGRRNIVTLAWSMPVSHQPPLVGIAVARTHFSTELINKGRAFVVNVPDITLLDKVMICGSCSGRVQDKFLVSGLTPVPPQKVPDVPWVGECLGHIECQVRDIHEAGDHVIVVGDPVYACADEEVFSDHWRVDKVRLIYHLGGEFFTTSSEAIRKERRK